MGASQSDWPGRGSAGTTDLERTLDSIIERLASPEWSVRESASAELLALPMPEAQQPIVRRLQLGGLSPEQRHRLVDAASRRLLEQPRGAIGISMDGLPNAVGGVRVSALVPGMPAVQVLRVGDVIEAINDQPIVTRQTLSEIVQGLKPGTPIRMRVQRPVLDEQGRARRDRDGKPVSQPVDVTLRLGSMDDLDAVDRGDRPDRGARGGFRATSEVQLLREAEAKWIRREFGSRTNVVRFDGAPTEVTTSTFAGRLGELERQLDQLEASAWRDRSDAVELLSAAARGIDALEERMQDDGVTDRDRQRMAEALQRLARILSRNGAEAPFDRLLPPR